MDVRLPGTDGIDALVAIRGEFPRARIIMLSTSTATERFVGHCGPGRPATAEERAVERSMTQRLFSASSSSRGPSHVRGFTIASRGFR
jgi:CheY-like chemotaxis protein